MVINESNRDNLMEFDKQNKKTFVFKILHSFFQQKSEI